MVNMLTINMLANIGDTMTGFDPNESIGFHCSLTYRAFAQALSISLSETGISSAQFIAIAHLKALGPLPQSELAGYLSTSSVSVVKLIDRMEKDGWVQRKPSLEDRRIKLVVLTEKATSVWESLSVHAQELVKQAYKGISRKEIDSIKRTLGKIRKNLSV